MSTQNDKPARRPLLRVRVGAEMNEPRPGATPRIPAALETEPPANADAPPVPGA